MLFNNKKYFFDFFFIKICLINNINKKKIIKNYVEIIGKEN